MGEWRANAIHGQGTLVSPDGTRYQGGWAHDLKQGLGRKIYANGDVYEVMHPYRAWLVGLGCYVQVPVRATGPCGICNDHVLTNLIHRMMQCCCLTSQSYVAWKAPAQALPV